MYFCLCEVYVKIIENEKEKFILVKIGYNCFIYNLIILGRKVLKDVVGFCINSCRIFRNLLMICELVVFLWCSILDNCWWVKVWSSGLMICFVIVGLSWIFKFLNNVNRKFRNLLVVFVIWVNIYVLMVDI